MSRTQSAVKRAELDGAHVDGDPGQFVDARTGPGEHRRPAHSAMASSPPAGNTPSRTGTTASIRSG